MNKVEYQSRINAYTSAFTEVARSLGTDHAMTKIMGGLAWGRYDPEGGPDQQGVKALAVRYGFLLGCERMLVSWCNANGEYGARCLLLDTLRENR